MTTDQILKILEQHICITTSPDGEELVGFYDAAIAIHNAIVPLEDRSTSLSFTIDKLLEKMPQWIPVSERLPDDRKQYLCVVKSLVPSFCSGPVSYFKITKLNPAKTGFYVEYTEVGNKPIEEVTHWQELPEPPKES